MLEKGIRNAIERATVTFMKSGGRGILVPGNLVITAAHCIGFSCEGEMALGDSYVEGIKTGQGDLMVTPWAIEPVSDIAVVGSLDNQTFPSDADAFMKFSEKTDPVQLCQIQFESFEGLNS